MIGKNKWKNTFKYSMYFCLGFITVDNSSTYFKELILWYLVDKNYAKFGEIENS